MTRRLSDADVQVRFRITELYSDPMIKENLRALRKNIRSKEVGYFKSGSGKYRSYYVVKRSVKLVYVPNNRDSELLFLEYISDTNNLNAMENKIISTLEYAMGGYIEPNGLTVVEIPVLEL